MMKKNQKVWVLVTNTPSYSYMPMAYVAEGIIKQATLSPPYAGSKHYCDVVIIKPKNSPGGWEKRTSRVLKRNVLPKRKENYIILQQKAKKFVESVIRQRRKETAEIEKKYSKLLNLI